MRGTALQTGRSVKKEKEDVVQTLVRDTLSACDEHHSESVWSAAHGGEQWSYIHLQSVEDPTMEHISA